MQALGPWFVYPALGVVETSLGGGGWAHPNATQRLVRGLYVFYRQRRLMAKDWPPAVCRAFAAGRPYSMLMRAVTPPSTNSTAPLT